MVVFSSRGKSGSIGSTSVCCSETTVPHIAKVPTTTALRVFLTVSPPEAGMCRSTKLLTPPRR
ncbi:hypothetical protein GCM10027575_59690 [Phytohabitans suffuscus]